MRELDLQSLVLDAVKARGGFGFKLAHKFLIGPPDLLVVLPSVGISLWEVKQITYKKPPAQVEVEVSPLQFKYLESVHNAGGRSGVVSFVQVGAELWVAALSTDALRNRVTTFYAPTYFKTSSRLRRDRMDVIIKALEAV